MTDRTVTREQALAFVDALVPTTFIDQAGHVPVRADSRVHLEAVLGQGNVPTCYEADHACNYPKSSYRPKLEAFLDYLQGVVDALRPEGYGTCATRESQPAEG